MPNFTRITYDAVEERKTANFSAFQLQHSVVAPSGGAETDVNTDSQLQTFPYTAVS